MNATTVIVFDDEGRVRSATPGAGALLGTPEPQVGATLADTLAVVPTLRLWVSVAAYRARTVGIGDACVDFDATPAPVEIRIAPVSGDAAGFVLVASPAEPPAPSPDGVTQRAWHDIKNQLGGLKLYATFLKMKFGGQDELLRETAEKIVGGVDAVVVAIAEARREGAVSKGETA
jgi:nitrogen fixation/metabolism regulation signal transduction histidine kinase